MKITVITAITTNNDKLRQDFPKTNARFVAFLDDESWCHNKDDNKLWEIEECHDEFDEPRRNAKIHKIMPHKYVDTDISIWLDANMSLNISPEELAELWAYDKDVATCRHFERDCLYAEAEACKTWKLDDPKLIDAQMKRYREDGYVAGAGLSECGVIVRKHKPEINKLNELWWEEIVKGSSRDQLSFNYIFRGFNQVQANARHSPIFNYGAHNVSRANYYEKFYV